VPVSGADAAYYYSTYKAEDSVGVSPKRKVMILGGGPNRIGQGIEFDYYALAVIDPKLHLSPSLILLSTDITLTVVFTKIECFVSIGD